MVRVRGLGFWGLGFRVWGIGLRGLGFRVWGLEFRVQGSGPNPKPKPQIPKPVFDVQVQVLGLIGLNLGGTFGLRASGLRFSKVMRVCTASRADGASGQGKLPRSPGFRV